MKKTLLSVLLCVVLVLSLAACGSNNYKNKTDETATKAPETTAEATPEATPEVTDEVTPEVTNAPEVTDEPVITDEPEVTDVPDADGGSTIVNPYEEVGSIEELNAALGCNLCTPGVMGVTDETFNIVHAGEYDIAQYTFTVSGFNFVFRSAATTDDISGIYTADGSTMFANTEEPECVLAADNCKAARWFTVDGQYELTVLDNGEMDNEIFQLIVDEVAKRTKGDYEDENGVLGDIVGAYMDSTGMRASAGVSNVDGKTTMVVSWANSATEVITWSMTLNVDENGYLVYNDCARATAVAAEDGSIETSLDYQDGEGYFEYIDGVLCWTGAAEEECRSCTFEKVEVAE